MMWMRPRGPSVSAASRSNVGQDGRQSPHETHWRASVSKRSRRVVAELDGRQTAPSDGGDELGAGGRSRPRGCERVALGRRHERQPPTGVVGPRARVRRQHDARDTACHARRTRGQARAELEPGVVGDRLEAAPASRAQRCDVVAAPRVLVAAAVLGDGQQTRLEHDERGGLGRVGAQRLGQREGVAAARQQPLAALG